MPLGLIGKLASKVTPTAVDTDIREGNETVTCVSRRGSSVLYRLASSNIDRFFGLELPRRD